MRKKNSFGVNSRNNGKVLVLKNEKYKMDHSRGFTLIDVIPMGAVRMNRSDKFRTNPDHPDPKKRARQEVVRYFAFKQEFVLKCNTMSFTIEKAIDAVYFIPMPDSWSEKKKERMNGMPHESKPDTDNITKAVKDALMKNDSQVWFEKAEKRWAYFGSMLFYDVEVE